MSIELRLKVEPGKPVLRGHDHYWSVIRDLGKYGRLFTTKEVAGRSNDPKDRSIADFLQRLRKAGFVEIAAKQSLKEGNRQPYHYRLLKRPLKTPKIRRDGTVVPAGDGQTFMWNAMRALGQFTASELAIAASTEDHSVSRRSALAYSTRLQQAGYLWVVSQGSGGRAQVWHLKQSMITGPQAPMILETKMVWDANREEIVGDAVAEIAS